MRRGKEGNIVKWKMRELRLKDRHQGMCVYFIYEVRSHVTRISCDLNCILPFSKAEHGEFG